MCHDLSVEGISGEQARKVLPRYPVRIGLEAVGIERSRQWLVGKELGRVCERHFSKSRKGETRESQGNRNDPLQLLVRTEPLSVDDNIIGFSKESLSSRSNHFFFRKLRKKSFDRTRDWDPREASDFAAHTSCDRGVTGFPEKGRYSRDESSSQVGRKARYSPGTGGITTAPCWSGQPLADDLASSATFTVPFEALPPVKVGDL